MSKLKLEQGDVCPQCEYGIISSFECGLGCGNCGFIVNKPKEIKISINHLDNVIFKYIEDEEISVEDLTDDIEHIEITAGDLKYENDNCVCGIIKDPPCPTCKNKYGFKSEGNDEINLEEFIIKKTEEKSKEIMDSKIKKVINDKLIKDDKEKSADCHDDTFDALSYAMGSFNIYKKESADVLCYNSYILFDAINKTENYCWLNWYAMKRDC